MHQRAEGSLPSLNGFKVLLVEDTWIIAQSYAGLLEPLGVQVVGPAANLADARRLLDKEIDAALVDMNMQGELAHDLIDELHGRDIPVVVVSAYEFVPRLEPKVVAVLKKPIRAELLLKTLRGLAASPTDTSSRSTHQHAGT